MMKEAKEIDEWFGVIGIMICAMVVYAVMGEILR